MLSQRSLAFMAAAVLVLGTARAQDITTVTPAEGTIGTVITIDGSGFGTVRPKVTLVDPATGKKYVLKVTANSDTQITGEVKRAVGGSLDVVVQPKIKGAAAITETAGFLVRAPVISALLDSLGGSPLTSAAPKQEFTVVGSFFGSKKGKVRIGGKPAKVVSWVPGGAVTEGDVATDVAVVAMPVSLANGLWPIDFSNLIGLDDQQQITMTGSTKKIGKANEQLTFNGADVPFKYTPAVAPPQSGHFAMYMTTATNPSKTFLVIVPFDVDSDPVPSTLESGPLSTLSAVYVETGKVSGFQVPPFATWSAGLGLGSITVNINASGGGQVAGSIEATLPLGASTFQTQVPQTIEVEGTFVFQL